MFVPEICLPAARRGRPGDQSVWNDLRVALASIAAYAPECRVIVAWSGDTEPRNLLPNDRMQIMQQPAGITTGSAAWNFAVSQSDSEHLLILGDDCVLTPDTLTLLNEDVAYLSNKVGDNLGWVGARSNFIKGPQNIRSSNGGQLNGICFDSEKVILEVPMIVPVCAWIRRDVYQSVGGFPNTNWFADDVMSWDLKQDGYRHFVSRSYCHHVGQRATGQGKSDVDLLREGLDWLQINRPDYYPIAAKMADGSWRAE